MGDVSCFHSDLSSKPLRRDRSRSDTRTRSCAESQQGSDASSSESVSIPNAAKLPSGSVPGPGSRSGARKRDEDEHRPGGRQETLDREIRFRGFATITPAAWQKESSLMLTISLDYLG